MRLDGATVVVTGASRGIGRAVAVAAAAKGARLGLIARTRTDLDKVVADLPGSGHAAATADVADAAAVQRALGELERDLGSVDVLVANAGIAYYGPFSELPAEEVERMTRVNWLGTAWTVEAALRHMLERRQGRIVVVSSAAGPSFRR